MLSINADGSLPNSSDHGPLTAADGPYAFQATYSGDANYLGGASGCEPLAVGQGTTSLTTVVDDAATDKAISSPVALNSTVYDTSAVHHSGGPIPTGSVTYTFFSSGDCTTGTVVGSPQVVARDAAGNVPSSSDHGPLTAAAGPYAFQAQYSGDGNYLAVSSDCEPFSVAQAAPSISTTVYDASTDEPVSGPLPLHASVYDTSVVAHPAGPTPTGTVTYTFFRSGDCVSGIARDEPELVGLDVQGNVPHSSSRGPLTVADGPFAFRATYSGDGNYLSATSACEPFAIAQGTTSVGTTVHNAATGAVVSGAIAFGSKVYDTAVVTGSGRTVPTGTVTYTFFRSGDCVNGSRAGTPERVGLRSDGTVPGSGGEGSLSAAGSPHAFRAEYSGDANYHGSTSACEPLEASRAAPGITTALSASSTQTGEPVNDSAALHGQSAGAGGTVAYDLYADRTCSTLVEAIGTVTVKSGVVPDSKDFTVTKAGTYYAQAAYSGDADNTAAKSACTSEVLTVKPVPVGAPQTGIATAGHDRGGMLALGSLLVLGGLLAIGAAARLRRRVVAS